MKKLFTICSLAVALVSFSESAKAQTSASSQTFDISIDVTEPVISITLGAEPNVSFVYGDAASYNKSNDVSKAGHFSVISNRPYDVVATTQGVFTSPMSNTLDLSIVEMAATIATGPGAGTTYTKRPLTTDGTNDLVDGALPTTNSVFNVDFSIPSATELLNLASEVYTTTVTYTATQQ